MFDFDSVEGQVISDLLTDYALIRIRESEALESSGGSSGEDDVVVTESGTKGAQTSRPFSTSVGSVTKALARTSVTSSSVPTPPPPPPAAPAAGIKSTPPPKPPASSGVGSTPPPPPPPPSAASRGTGSKLQLKNSSAVKLQAFIRGSLTRIRVTKMIEEMFETGELSVGSGDDDD
jgi:hypothetical protein